MKHLHDGPMAGRTVPVTGATSGIGRATGPGTGQIGRPRRDHRPEPRPHPAAIQRLLVPFLRPVMKSLAHGAMTSIHLASAPALEQLSGRYFANRRPTKSATRSYDQAGAARLWEACADLLGLTAAPRV